MGGRRKVNIVNTKFSMDSEDMLQKSGDAMSSKRKRKRVFQKGGALNSCNFKKRIEERETPERRTVNGRRENI